MRSYPGGIAKRRLILGALRLSSRPQTVQSLGELVGLRSSSSVQAHIERLSDAGLIEHVVGWRITSEGRAALRRKGEVA